MIVPEFISFVSIADKKKHFYSISVIIPKL